MTVWLESRPELAAGWRQLEGAIGDGPIPPWLIESCVQIVRRRVRLDVGGVEAPARSSPTAACFELAEQFAIDVHGVQDGHVTTVRDHFGDAGVVQLVVALGLAEGAARAEALLGGDGAGGR